jgi:hypothetical protein
MKSSVSSELNGVSSLVASSKRWSAFNQKVTLSPKSSAFESSGGLAYGIVEHEIS